MRRLIVEISNRAFSKFVPEKPLQKIRSAEVLHFLKFDHQEVAVILRVEFNEPNVSIEDLFGDDLAEVKILEQEKEKEREIYTYFIKVKPAQAIHEGPDLEAVGGYLSLPYEVRDGKIKITFLGSAKQVRAFLKTVEAAGVRYRVVSLTDARFPPHSLISHLTEKQQRAAHHGLYFWLLRCTEENKPCAACRKARPCTFHIGYASAESRATVAESHNE